MSNAYINLPCPTGTANGATTAVTTLANQKTMVVTGLLGGEINVEGTDDGTNWVAVLSITGDGVFYPNCTFASMRCKAVKVVGTVTVDIGSASGVVTDIVMNIPAGDGNGTAAVTAQLGVLLTITVGGTFQGTVTIEASNDNVNFAAIASFTAPGNQQVQGPFSRMRVHRAGTISGTPVVGVGASSDVAVATGAEAMFFGLTAGTGNAGASDYAGTVAVNAAVPFPRLGPAVGAGIVPGGTNQFVLPATGIYRVTWTIDFLEASQLLVKLGAVEQAHTCTMSGAGTQQNCNSVLVSATAGDLLSICNASGNATALTVQTADGSKTHAQAPSLLIRQIA